MSHKDGRVVLSAWVDPALRDYVREAARLSGLEFSRWLDDRETPQLAPGPRRVA